MLPIEKDPSHMPRTIVATLAFAAVVLPTESMGQGKSLHATGRVVDGPQALGPGVSLRDGQGEIMFYLPLESVEFRVLSYAGFVLANLGSSFQAKPTVLGEARITPRAGKVNTLEIKVKSPPDIGH